MLHYTAVLRYYSGLLLAWATHHLAVYTHTKPAHTFASAPALANLLAAIRRTVPTTTTKKLTSITHTHVYTLKSMYVYNWADSSNAM